ncbi:MAG: hypothetical protein LBH06_10090 [Rikenellaceae bacterium]|jgi:hypothetical protein|nr:hypothetical protein [Rikenellaceae bacterium]
MFDFLVAPLVTGICMATVYGLFELYARRRERIAIIEKLGSNLSPSEMKEQMGSLSPLLMHRKLSFSALKAGCLLIGVGLGLLAGFILIFCTLKSYAHSGEAGIVYGASVMLFGGVGLVVAFVIETRMARKRHP